MPDPSQPGAVFLSYAREDADAARRVADALRSQGVEVWFDESELRGGDAWDAKIRRQIKECALFAPIISERTQSRHEGYFRLEWKLAVERTHLMLEGVPFLAPVVIDATPDSAAAVPAEFLRVQWMHLPGALPTPQFVEQIKRLLAAPKRLASAPLSHAAAAGGAAAPGRSRRRLWIGGAAVLFVIAAAGAIISLRKPGGAVAQPAPAPVQASSPSSEAADSVPTDKSIAVLPFENISADPNNAYFCDGIQEDILTNLANIRELRVVSRTSVEQYRHTTKPLRQVAHELGVAWILEGSVQRAAETVRVTGQLVNGRTDQHLWAKSYDRPVADVFAIQSELAQTIAAALQAQLTPQELATVERPPTTNLAAYDLFNRARALENTVGYNGDRIIELCGAAVQLDPNFTQAWATEGLYRSINQSIFESRCPRNLADAKAAVDRAVALSRNLPEVMEAHACYLADALGDFQGAIDLLTKGLAAYPNDAGMQFGTACMYLWPGRWTESLAHMRESVRLDPANIFYANNLADLLEAGRRYVEAGAERRRLLFLVADRPRMEFQIALDAFWETGATAGIDAFFSQSHAQADETEMEKLRSGWNQWSGLADPPGSWQAVVKPGAEDPDYWCAVASDQVRLGRLSQALLSARKACSLNPESLRYSRQLADIYLLMGDKDQAISEYARLLREPFSGLNVHEMRREPKYAPLRADPRFEALLNDPKNNAPLF